MPLGPRVVFVRFVSGDSPKLSPWLAHVARVLGSSARANKALLKNDGVLVWQLVSANNRQLARSVAVYSSFESATASARAVVHSAGQLEVELVSEAGRGMYGWYATIAGNPVMTCARWYMTDRDRRNSIELALRSAGVATLHTGARLTDPALLGGDRDATD